MTVLGRLYTAVPTPLRSNFGVDVDRLAAHCLQMMNAGADGVVLFGTTGEGTFFSNSEKCVAAEAVIRAGLAPSRLILATGSCAIADVAHTLRASAALGCSAGLVLPPFFTKAVDDDGLFDWFAALVGLAPSARFLLYHIPAVAGVGISAGLAQRLFARFSEIIVGVKDSTPDSSLARALVPMRAKGVYVSTEADLRNFLTAGGAGVISATLNVSMPVAKAVVDGAHGKDEERLSETRRLLTQFPLIAAIKTILADRYSDPAWRRVAPPHQSLSAGEETRLLAALRSLDEAYA